jgi:DNA-binding IclR family transcriptional regulator
MNIRFVKRIIELFSKNPSRELTILQASKKAGLSYNATHRTIQALIKEGVLEHKKIGSAIVISLKKTPLALGYLALAHSSESESVEDLVEKVGDYAKKLS